MPEEQSASSSRSGHKRGVSGESDSQFAKVEDLSNLDTISMGSANTFEPNSQYVNKKYQIELNIKLLYVSD